MRTPSPGKGLDHVALENERLALRAARQERHGRVPGSCEQSNEEAVHGTCRLVFWSTLPGFAPGPAARDVVDLAVEGILRWTAGSCHPCSCVWGKTNV